MNYQDLIGKKFNRINIIGLCPKEESPNSKQKYLKCLCDCGREMISPSFKIVGGKIKSCKNCSQRLPFRDTKEYVAWNKIKNRCYGREPQHQKSYRDKGIIMSEDWKKSFDIFLSDMGFAPTSKHSIDRISNDGNYEKDNCKWSTQTQQVRNRSCAKYITISGQKKLLVEFCNEFSLNYSTCYGKLRISQEKFEEYLKKRMVVPIGLDVA